MAKSQHFNGQDHDPSDVLALLRQNFRVFCGLPQLEFDVPVGELELEGIFAFSYRSYYGTASAVPTRSGRWIKDLADYRKTGVVPYYVMHAHHRVRTENSDQIVLSDQYWEHYVFLCQGQETPIPDRSHYEMSSL